MYEPMLGDKIRFANSLFNSDVVYKIENIGEKYISVSTEFSMGVYYYSLSRQEFENLNPHLYAGEEND